MCSRRRIQVRVHYSGQETWGWSHYSSVAFFVVVSWILFFTVMLMHSKCRCKTQKGSDHSTQTLVIQTRHNSLKFEMNLPHASDKWTENAILHADDVKCSPTFNSGVLVLSIRCTSVSFRTFSDCPLTLEYLPLEGENAISLQLFANAWKLTYFQLSLKSAQGLTIDLFFLHLLLIIFF